MEKFPSWMLAGEVCQVPISFSNCGWRDLQSLYLATSLPENFTVIREVVGAGESDGRVRFEWQMCRERVRCEWEMCRVRVRCEWEMCRVRVRCEWEVCRVRVRVRLWWEEYG